MGSPADRPAVSGDGLMLAARNEPLGLGDLLPWGALVGEGVVVNKDGSFLAGWRYRGPDVDAATPSELLALARHLEQALRTLGGDWMLHADAVRAPAPGYPAEGDFPDAVTRLIDAERREQYRAAHSSFETRCVLCATWLPPAESTARARGWLVEGAEDEGGRLARAAGALWPSARRPRRLALGAARSRAGWGRRTSWRTSTSASAGSTTPSHSLARPATSTSGWRARISTVASRPGSATFTWRRSV